MKIFPKTVLFLGAGASVPYGYPVTAGILQRIWNGLESTDDKSGWHRWAGMKGRAEEAKQLRRLLEALFPGLAEGVALNPDVSIVDVISLVDQLASEGRSPSPILPERALLAARSVLGKAINGVLQGRGKLGVATRFAQWALRIATEQADSRMTVISTNYDTAFELPLLKLFVKHGISVGRHVDFGMTWRDAYKDLVHFRPLNSRLALFKLHGSLNWLRCEVCGHVTMNVVKRIASLDSWQRRTRGEYNVCWCGGRLRSLLVTPSIVRDVRDASLLGIWKAALEDLRMADEWIFIGYSLPAEDISIRSLLLRAWHARRHRRLSVRVVQFEKPEDGNKWPGGAYNRFRLLFPPSALKEADYSRDGVLTFVARLELLSAETLAARVRKHFGGRSAIQIATRERDQQSRSQERSLARQPQRKRRRP